MSIEGVQTNQFWKELSISYTTLVTKFGHLFILDTNILENILPAAVRVWTQFLNKKNMLKLDTTEAGIEMFAATKAIQNYRKISKESLFQPTFISVDPRSNIRKIIKSFRKAGQDMYPYVEFETSRLFHIVDLQTQDLSSLKNVTDKMMDSLDKIALEVEK